VYHNFFSIGNWVFKWGEQTLRNWLDRGSQEERRFRRGFFNNWVSGDQYNGGFKFSGGCVFKRENSFKKFGVGKRPPPPPLRFFFFVVFLV